MMDLEHQRITKEKLQEAKIDHEKIEKFAELFPNGARGTSANFFTAGFSFKDLLKVHTAFFRPPTITTEPMEAQEKESPLALRPE
jgi:hypothetical protein